MKALKMRHAAWCLALVLLLALALALCVLPAGAEDCQHAEGYENGFCIGCGDTQQAPLNEGVYEISNAGQLYWFADQLRAKQPAPLMKARLMCNITVNADLLNADGQPRTGARPWVPLGDATNVMTGVELNGQGYYISGLYARCEDGDDHDVGLFGKASFVVVKNLGIVDSYFRSYSGFVGGIIANAADASQIDHCYVAATLESGNNGGIGGIAGALEKDTVPCAVSYCYTTYSAAIYGANAETVIVNCFYRAESETDSLGGTAYYKADLTLDDGTKLADALALGSTAWVKNCRTGLLALKTEHVYAYVCTSECTVCGDTDRADQAAHKYDNECDRSCNVCGRVNPAEVNHVAYQTCGTVCRYCGETIPALTAHQYSDACDPTCDCGFERDVVPHLYDDDCDSRCNLCGEIREAVPHKYENSCDRVCDCGVTRPIAHTYDNGCDADCNVCGEKRAAEHAFGEYVVTKEATALRNGEQERTCTVCGHKETQTIARLGVATWIIVLGGVGTGLVLSVGGFALFWFVIKKRTFADFLGK